MSFFPYSKTQIHIIECHRKFLSKTACRFKCTALHHHARRRYSTHILKDRSLVEISGSVRRHVNKHMACNAADTDHTACMLDRIVRIDQLHADRPDFSSLADTEHFFDPARGDHRHVIVKEQ